MTHQATTNVFKFCGLSESAQDKVRDYVRANWDVYGWSDESLESIKAFCDHFGVTLENWSVGPFSPIEYRHSAENHNFRGVKLSSIDPQHMHTGFYLDLTLWETMHREFKRTGDAKHAFDAAVYAGLRVWREDWEAAYSDESIDDLLTVNQYQFTEDGEIF